MKEKIIAALKSSVTSGLFTMLDSIITLIHGQAVAGTGIEDEVKQALATLVLWEPQVRAGAARTDTTYDDRMVDEILQAAERILGADLVTALRAMHPPADPIG